MTSGLGGSSRGPGSCGLPSTSMDCSAWPGGSLVFGAELRRSSATAGVMSAADLGLSLIVPSGPGVPGEGGDMKSLKELSVTRGAFHGNRRSDMQAKIIARDHMSVG